MSDGNGESGDSERWQRPPDALRFERAERIEYALLKIQVGTGWNQAVPGTNTAKPIGTEWATEADLLAAGYVPKRLLDEAIKRIISVENEKEIQEASRETSP